MQINEFLLTHGIRMTAEPANNNPNMANGAAMDHWRVTFRAGRGKRFTTYFSMGSGHDGAPPAPADVLDCLASDALSIQNTRDFADWCADFGYDTDSRQAHKTYQTTYRQGARLQRFLGEDAYLQLLSLERP